MATSARRKLEPVGASAAPSAQGTTAQPAQETTLAEVAKPIQNSLTYTAPPTIADRIAVGVIRGMKVLSKLVGFNIMLEIGNLTSSYAPPFYVKYGLNITETEYEVSPGTVWKAWELQPPEPSGKTVIAVHGGGWIIQPTWLHWIDYTSMARDTGATVIVPMYPLATTTDGMALKVVPGMANFIAQQIALHGAENVSIYGDSAGSNIAIAAVRELILRGDTLPSSMVLLSMGLDYSASNPAILEFDDPIFDTHAVGAAYNAGHWIDGIEDLQDPMISPLFFESEVLKALPPTTIYVGSEEFLVIDSLVLHQRAVDEGAPIALVVGRGQVHDWALGGIPLYSQTPLVRPDVFRQLGIIPSKTAV